MVRELSKEASVLNRFLSEIRDVDVQKDRMRFRRNLERIGEVMAYEISKTFSYSKQQVITPLGEAAIELADLEPVLVTILRAGLPFHQGFLNYFDGADNGFVSAYRRAHKGGDFEIDIDYVSCPSLEDRDVIICDPMIATGSSIDCVYKSLTGKGTPRSLHVASVIASEQGLRHLRSRLPENLRLWSAVVDNELTAQAYIVPGLGDAGDLAFGSKQS